MKLKTFAAMGCILLSNSVYSSQETQCSFLENLSPYQYGIAYQAYRTGQPYDLGFTMVAIAWKESKLGLYKIRMGTPPDISFGVFHTASHWKTKGMTAFERGRWAQVMVENDAKSIQVGVSDLLSWKVSAKGKWSRMVEMYNAGYGKNPVYLKEVKAIMREIKHCEF